MSSDPDRPSFSSARKWAIIFNVLVAVVLVIGIAAMANYLSGQHSRRIYLSTTTRVELSPRTLLLLNSITNPVQITLYYDTDDPSYPTIVDLLKEYQSHNSKVELQVVDYRRNAARAEQLKTQHQLGSATNLIIFDTEGAPSRILEGDKLTQKELVAVGTEGNQILFDRKPVAFWGERMFTAVLVSIANPKPLNAFVLQGHGEHNVASQDSTGFSAFANVLRLNNIQVEPLLLLGTNTIPTNCNLLVIPGPTTPLPPPELAQIQQYLESGGRLLAMFNFASTNRTLGLEELLERWGVRVSPQTVTDPQFTTAPGADVIVLKYSEHPSVSLLSGSQLQLILPRSVTSVGTNGNSGIVVKEVAYSGPESFLGPDPGSQTPRPLPVMAAVEKGEVDAALGDGRVTRILVVGDSLFLINSRIAGSASRDFAELAAGWLAERNVLPEALGPRPLTDYRLLIPRVQMQSLRWILLGALPGSIMLLGGFVWLSRRK